MSEIATAVDPFMFRLSIFVLAVFVGYYVVWSVTPAISPRRRSNGAATVAAMMLGSAPGRLALTLMVGKSTLGRLATGRKM